MAPAARPIIASVSLVILAGGVLLQFLTILSGGVNSSPLDQFYFLQAATNAIPNARNPSRWTFFAVCGVDDRGHNADCGKSVPALPFDPPLNFGTTENIPEPFLGTRHYYYLSRFMFAFYLIALFFAVVALFTGLLAMCSRLGGYISALTTATALFFQTIAAALMTAWVVQGRDAFRSAGHDSHVGVKLIAFTWTAMACFFISTVLFCGGGAIGRESGGIRRKRSTRSSRTAKNRGSFLDNESQRRAKDNYS
ncbi:SUR7-domain-containing protein [Massarina eburnea CBS 473.64]|uniref:SUR7-domain-containing protein n=1 Tax=Massarina eburnea CBS 473.64 TaxID=1395130 RepID=A0A6A6S786_9PLEO|nr:SUR7-domain-containing protein [Massarina eburnea CBS 473.64]